MSGSPSRSAACASGMSGGREADHLTAKLTTAPQPHSRTPMHDTSVSRRCRAGRREVDVRIRDRPQGSTCGRRVSHGGGRRPGVAAEGFRRRGASRGAGPRQHRRGRAGPRPCARWGGLSLPLRRRQSALWSPPQVCAVPYRAAVPLLVSVLQALHAGSMHTVLGPEKADRSVQVTVR